MNSENLIIGKNVVIEPNVYFDPNAIIVLGDNVRIGRGSHLEGNINIGNNTKLSPYSIIGTPGEDRKETTDEAVKNGVIIGSNTIIREFVTINAPVGSITLVGNDCYLMAKSHVGHDGKLENGVVLSTGAEVGGHSRLGDKVVLGLNAITKNRTTISPYTMIGALTPVTNDTYPFTIVRGSPARWYGVNVVGIQREDNLDENDIKIIESILKNDLIIDHPNTNIIIKNAFRFYGLHSKKPSTKFGGRS